MTVVAGATARVWSAAGEGAVEDACAGWQGCGAGILVAGGRRVSALCARTSAWRSVLGLRLSAVVAAACTVNADVTCNGVGVAAANVSASRAQSSEAGSGPEPVMLQLHVAVPARSAPASGG